MFMQVQIGFSVISLVDNQRKKGKQQKTSKYYKNISKTAVCRLEYFRFGDNSIENSVISIALC